VIIEILIVACLQRAPDECRDFSIISAEQGGSILSCMMQSQIELVKWKEMHPQWDIARWSCTSRREDAAEA
jgi:hypothetical protein